MSRPDPAFAGRAVFFLLIDLLTFSIRFIYEMGV